MWHVNDPEEFWDAKRIPAFAKERGWFYGPESVQYEDQYRQVMQVLQRHPGLKIILAHLYFMSAKLQRIRDLLRRFPNVCVDLTPGIELYVNLGKIDREEVLGFFDDFQDRIMYGTDIGARCVLSSDGIIDEAESMQRVTLCRRFLGNEGVFTVRADGNFLIGSEDVTVEILGLPEHIRQKILHDNFLNFVGGPPSPVSRRHVLRECRRIRFMLRIMSYADRGFEPDFSAVMNVREFFNNL